MQHDTKGLKPWNSGGKSECPLNGQCEITDMTYKCTVLSKSIELQWSGSLLFSLFV